MTSAAMAACRLALRSTMAPLGGSSKHAACMALPRLAQQPIGSSAVRLVHGGPAGGGVVCMGFGSHMSDNDPKVIKKEKERNLSGCDPEFVPGLRGWNERLASDSEAALRADHTDVTMQEMMVHTETVVEEVADLDVCDPTPKPVIAAKYPDIVENLKYDDRPDTFGEEPL